MIRDRNIDWLRSVYRIPYHLFGYEPTHLHTITILGGVATATKHIARDIFCGAIANYDIEVIARCHLHTLDSSGISSRIISDISVG